MSSIIAERQINHNGKVWIKGGKKTKNFDRASDEEEILTMWLNLSQWECGPEVTPRRFHYLTRKWTDKWFKVGENIFFLSMLNGIQTSLEAKKF